MFTSFATTNLHSTFIIFKLTQMHSNLYITLSCTSIFFPKSYFHLHKHLMQCIIVISNSTILLCSLVVMHSISSNVFLLLYFFVVSKLNQRPTLQYVIPTFATLKCSYPKLFTLQFQVCYSPNYISNFSYNTLYSRTPTTSL